MWNAKKQLTGKSHNKNEISIYSTVLKWHSTVFFLEVSMVMEYAWKKIPYVVEQFRKENAIELYMIIQDDIFRLLNKYCIVIYYPLEDESNWGFRTRRFVNGKLADFVYINKKMVQFISGVLILSDCI